LICTLATAYPRYELGAPPLSPRFANGRALPPQATGDLVPTSDARRLATRDRRPATSCPPQTHGGWGPATGDRRPPAHLGHPAVGDPRPATSCPPRTPGGWRPATGDRQPGYRRVDPQLWQRPPTARA
jgi:hypothetical protein